MLHVRFRVIMRGQPFSRAQSHTLKSHTSWERSFYNFRVAPLLIIVIWPKYATRAISHDSDTATFFVCPRLHAIIPTLQ